VERNGRFCQEPVRRREAIQWPAAEYVLPAPLTDALRKLLAENAKARATALLVKDMPEAASLCRPSAIGKIMIPTHCCPVNDLGLAQNYATTMI